MEIGFGNGFPEKLSPSSEPEEVEEEGDEDEKRDSAEKTRVDAGSSWNLTEC